MTEASELALTATQEDEEDDLSIAQPEVLPLRKSSIEKLGALAVRVPGVEATKEIWADTEKRRMAILLGAVGVGTTVLEFGNFMKGMPLPLQVIRDGGRHLDVGYLSAMAAASKQRFKTIPRMVGGMLLAGMAGDFAAEAGEAVTVTGLLHDGWSNVGTFLSHQKLFWGNIEDAIVAMSAASYATLREGLRRRQEV